MLRRLKAACRTNDTQVTSVIAWSLGYLALSFSDGWVSWWFHAACVLFWPTIAFTANLIDPIPHSDPGTAG